MSLDKLQSQLKSSAKDSNSLPPVELWDPPYCGEIDMVIKTDGQWFYNGTPITRMPLVKLFASVIKKEADEYFLVTPVEKIKIQVEHYPLIVTQWQLEQVDNQQAITVETNLGDIVTLGATHPLVLENESLIVNIRRNLWAKVNRNVYYQWVDIGVEEQNENRHDLVIESCGEKFSLGSLL